MRCVVTAIMLSGLAYCASSAGDPPKEPKRFDHVVREDIFAGFNGDKDRMAKGLKTCEETLAKNPKHAEALVWRGAANLFNAGTLFGDKKVDEGRKLWTEALADLDAAVKLDPKNVGVRIPRAASLMGAIQNAPEAVAKPLLDKALDDFKSIYDQQKDYLNKLGTHPHGELRMGLAEVYRRKGEADKSKEQLEAIVKDLPDTRYATRAKEWLAAKPDAVLKHSCIGCHTEKKKD